MIFQKKIDVFSTFKSETSTNTLKNEQKDSANQEIETKIIIFWLIEIYLLKLKMVMSCRGGTQRIKNKHIFPRFAGRYFSATPFSVHS